MELSDLKSNLIDGSALSAIDLLEGRKVLKLFGSHWYLADFGIAKERETPHSLLTSRCLVMRHRP